MWWWPSIDNVRRTGQMFECVTTKQCIYFLMGMTLLSGILALVGIIQLRMNPNVLNQIPDPVVLAVTGIVGFSFFLPWFIVTYFARYFLSTVRALEGEIQRLHEVIDGMQ